jgi:hypothetical protein
MGKKIRRHKMIAQPNSEEKYCPHCLGRRCCDCESCGQKARYFDFGGTRFSYYESGKCKVCGGKGIISDLTK